MEKIIVSTVTFLGNAVGSFVSVTKTENEISGNSFLGVSVSSANTITTTFGTNDAYINFYNNITDDSVNKGVTFNGIKNTSFTINRSNDDNYIGFGIGNTSVSLGASLSNYSLFFSIQSSTTGESNISTEVSGRTDISLFKLALLALAPCLSSVEIPVIAPASNLIPVLGY